MHHPMPLPSVPLIPAAKGITFTGERPEFRKLVTRGAWLELITLGFYRFWLATDMRRPERSLQEQAKGGERSPKALVFLVLLWLAMFVRSMVSVTRHNDGA